MRPLIIWSVIGTGISSIAVQLVTIREFLTQFHGNEITISIVLFSWLLLTGVGSLAAKASKGFSLTSYSLLAGLIALWPLPQIILIRELREIVFIHGVAPGFYHVFLYISLLIAPYCFSVGFVLPYAQKTAIARGYTFSSGELYVTDSAGDIVGGILFSLVLVYWVKPFKTLAITSGLLILVVFLLFLSHRKYGLFVFMVILSSFFVLFSLNARFEIGTLFKQYGSIVRYLESPYGRIVITKEGTQHTFWESGTPFYSEVDIIHTEEKVHYPLSQLKNIQKVLLVSGGLGETLREISKYKPKSVDYVELDPYLTRVAKELGFIKESRCLRVVNSDGRLFIKNATGPYSAIIVDLPDPDTFQLNRFYTSEFFSSCRNILTPNGILSFSLTYSPNYQSELEKKKLSIIYNTARQYFKNVLVLPGSEAYFLCRSGPLSKDIPVMLAAKGIKTSYISGFYYGNVTAERIEAIKKSVSLKTLINTDFEPRAMKVIFQQWFVKHGTSPKFFLLGILIFTGLYLAFMKKEEYILFSTGLANMGTEMLVVFTFQLIFGYIYLKIGAIVTAFLLGLLPGALAGNLSSTKKWYDLILSDLMLLCLLLAFFAWATFSARALHPFYFLAYGFVFSFFCGYQFPAATRIIGEERSPAAGCLAADLTGAALGTLVTGTVLIPLFGIQWAVIFLILVKISSNIILLYTKRRGAYL
ncbi:MAG: fused MFS/spermidine synthase [Deltaproteobacteria bacterium]|nr:fused MFS/spermidine synthase [Deltaproteobacteria bacterium]